MGLKLQYTCRHVNAKGCEALRLRYPERCLLLQLYTALGLEASLLLTKGDLVEDVLWQWVWVLRCDGQQWVIHLETVLVCDVPNLDHTAVLLRETVGALHVALALGASFAMYRTSTT